MRIGLTQRVLFHKERAYDSIEHGWYSCLKEHTLIFIPNRIDIDVDIDMLIITGGDNHPVRNQLENRLVQQMILEGKPVIGICHGAFLLTKILGGKVDKITGHMDTSHQIILEGNLQTVNSFHTLQIVQHPEQSKVLAVDTNNVCESWIYKNIGAVVWHPERMDKPVWPKQIRNLFNG
jgi:gamma-glutamyl-gamma-aminobutyrate hydrolase PuuD